LSSSIWRYVSVEPDRTALLVVLFMSWHLPCERVISDRKHFKWFMKRRILVVEDEEKLRRVLELQLPPPALKWTRRAPAEEALKVVDRADLVLTDLRLPQMDGLELLAAIRRQNSQTPVIVMTAFGTIETAVEAMKTGATDFLLKPFSLDHLMRWCRRRSKCARCATRTCSFAKNWGGATSSTTSSAAARHAGDLRHHRARGAHARHRAAGGRERRGQGSDRARHPLPFAAARPAAGEDQLHRHPENLMESELFGYEKGAFTGAMTTKPGKFEQADTGTVFLDEIGDVPGPFR
jgi:DNA-binding NtrC family response regulator